MEYYLLLSLRKQFLLTLVIMNAALTMVLVRLHRLDDSSLVLMVLVSLTVGVLVVLAILLIVLQCWRFRARFRKFRKKFQKEAAGDATSQSDSDYSSYTGGEEKDVDDLEQSTVFSDRTDQRESVYPSPFNQRHRQG